MSETPTPAETPMPVQVTRRHVFVGMDYEVGDTPIMGVDGKPAKLLSFTDPNVPSERFEFLIGATAAEDMGRRLGAPHIIRGDGAQADALRRGGPNGSK